MGHWKLEVAKFALYIFAPVAAFYYFHRVEHFEDKLAEYYRKKTSPASIQNEKMIKECQDKMRKIRDARFKEELLALNKIVPTETEKGKQS